jgi:hypothetical protein
MGRETLEWTGSFLARSRRADYQLRMGEDSKVGVNFFSGCTLVVLVVQRRRGEASGGPLGCGDMTTCRWNTASALKKHMKSNMSLISYLFKSELSQTKLVQRCGVKSRTRC